MKELSLDKIWQQVSANFAESAIKVITALILFYIGIKVINVLLVGTKKFFEKKKIEKTLSSFFVVCFSAILKVALVISLLGYVGIDTTSFAALLASAGLAIGFALKGSLSSLAGGVMIVAFKPFKVGEFIQAQGESGTVKEILLMNTMLTTADNKTIFLPNGPLATGKVVNFSRQDTRRVDLVFGIGYDDDLKKAKDLLLQIANEEERVLKDQPIVVAVNELADSSVNFVFRVFVNKADYWAVYWDTVEKVKLTFDAEGVSIPFPQRDVHVYNK
ncbi:mechanosensitive ion channel [Halobacteriovorax sp. GB3]|uniref:mechanosensitive ion channel family protein n=1 Tax=Halobacteriovorax sp. GB3 TaxID=2719615 RepID=UPI00236135A0|nr:mechanosensitive ion channel domain-containing protein [Halobacteriovorax sp. GB3]MDD0852216.1 mechanosensitive ion channel [Halobacteriovorax sp. GB3]